MSHLTGAISSTPGFGGAKVHTGELLTSGPEFLFFSMGLGEQRGSGFGLLLELGIGFV